jgi:eukaryotic-like serine/threonine-protein kinase
MAEEARKLIEVLRLPFESMRTLSCSTGEVRKYRNELTGAIQVGKRVSWVGRDERAVVLREAELLQKIRHPNIVPVVDVAVVEGEPDGDPAVHVIEMIMPFYPKGSIYDSLVGGYRHSVGEAVKLAREALSGLGELHEAHRLLHRDIKSTNVFIDNDDRALLGDFGQVVPMDDAGTAEHFRGNQIYSPPEALLEGRCTRATDIYGVGLLLFELLTGPFPYDEYTPDQIFARLNKGKRPVRDADLVFKPFVPPRLRTIVTTAISRDGSRRYASAREMADALNAAPIIDWRATSGEDDELVWEGTCAADRGAAYQVKATPKKGGRWRFKGRRRLTQWRTIVEDQIVTDPTGIEARDFFDRVVRVATSD